MKKYQKKLNYWKELRKRLYYELDIFGLINSGRYASLMSRIALKKYQKQLIPSFKNYNLNMKKWNRTEKLKKRALKKETLELDDFNPESNMVDNMILY